VRACVRMCVCVCARAPARAYLHGALEIAALISRNVMFHQRWFELSVVLTIEQERSPSPQSASGGNDLISAWCRSYAAIKASFDIGLPAHTVRPRMMIAASKWKRVPTGHIRTAVVCICYSLTTETIAQNKRRTNDQEISITLAVLSDVRNANIITIYNTSDCENYRGIALLSIFWEHKHSPAFIGIAPADKWNTTREPVCL